MHEKSLIKVFQEQDVIVPDSQFTEIGIPKSLVKIIERLPLDEKLGHIISSNEGNIFLSKCKEGEVKQFVDNLDAYTVIYNVELSGSQVRHLDEVI